MKTRTFRLLSFFAIAFATTWACAQSGIKVKVPFDFVVGDKTLPAGQYSVTASRDLLIVSDLAGTRLFAGIANAVAGRRVGKTGEVVFRCFDSRCFLSEFWTPLRENGSQLLTSRYEAELSKHQTGAEFVLLEQQVQFKRR